jgi:L,D-transpeptidase catalytic domain
MQFYQSAAPTRSCVRVAYITLASWTTLITATDLADAARLRTEPAIVSRPFDEPIMAIVSLRDQQITVYDDKGWIMRAPVSSGQKGRETPAGIFTVLQKDAEHYSNIYDDAYMPYMQRLTWSGIALHGGVLPGYPASHGCVRMPYDFAERLFGTTRLGMRVIVAPSTAVPVAIDHPVLFQPKNGAAAAVAVVATAAAVEATRKGDQTRRVAIMAYREWLLAMMQARRAQTLKLKAERELAGADDAIASATSAEAKQQAKDTKAELVARASQLEVQLAASSAELQPKRDAMVLAREAATTAEHARLVANETARKAARDLEPVSVFISRKTQLLYVRQALQPVMEIPVTIQEAGRPIGTHIFTAMERVGAHIRWNAVSLVGGRADVKRNGVLARESPDNGITATDSAAAEAALDRITIPQEALDFIAERVGPRSSLVISDEALGPETGKDTEFVVLLSGAPQGGVKYRRSPPRVEVGNGEY